MNRDMRARNAGGSNTATETYRIACEWHPWTEDIIGIEYRIVASRDTIPGENAVVAGFGAGKNRENAGIEGCGGAADCSSGIAHFDDVTAAVGKLDVCEDKRR